MKLTPINYADIVEGYTYHLMGIQFLMRAIEVLKVALNMYQKVDEYM